MIGPTWLAAIFGVIMLAAAVVALVRIIATWRSRGPTNYGVSGQSGMSGMSAMGGSGGIVPWPTLDYALVIFMIGYAVLAIDRIPALAANGRGHLVTVGPPATGTAATPLAPTTAAVINIVMAITMAYMLTMMFA